MMVKSTLRRQLSLKLGASLRYLCIYNLLALSIVTILAAASNISSGNNESHHDLQRDLSNIPGTTACAACTTEGCISTNTVTVSSHFCNPCSDGQQWWPCNIPGACYCADENDPIIGTIRQETLLGSDACSTAACTSLGGSCVSSNANVNDDQCADCEDGKQSWWPCNQMGYCSCKIPTEAPTSVPSQAPQQSSPLPGDDDLAEQEDSSLAAADSKSSTSTQFLEGMLVLDAHITANKIVLARELFLTPSLNGAEGNSFTYMGFKKSLQQFILTPIIVDGKDPKTMEDIEVPLRFYIGDTTKTSANSKNSNERVYGLVNVALFLATSYSNSLSNGSCDEINFDVVNGVLPTSNACGQQGMSYQGTSPLTSDFQRSGDDSSSLYCAPGDEKYACDVDLNMRARARPPSNIAKQSGAASVPGPFYCGPKTDYNGSTGHWSFEENEEIFQSATQNRLGRTDVQGCCFWGRGSVPIKGTCAYGKLNYFLGKRAADEGRPAMFPDIDFCKNPSAICGDMYPDLKWIVGFFRWIMEIQEYDVDGFHYMKKLRRFVDDGFQDLTFIDSISGIVSQGCHSPPCIEGVPFYREEKRANFLKIMEIFGFSVNM